jgi:competence protein CoiA
MLSATRQFDGKSVLAHHTQKFQGPFRCPECSEVVILRRSNVRITHFAHAKSGLCNYSAGESEAHRRCKLEIYEALIKHPNATDVALERSLTTARPDVSVRINGVPVAIEVQISNLSMETIIRRTQEYARKGIYVLWLLQWTPYLDGSRYSPRLWEKWIHAAYFGRVYYWLKGLTVACYHFDPHFNTIHANSWYSKTGKKVVVGGYNRRSKRFRAPSRERILNLATDFGPRDRERWTTNDLLIPDAKLFLHRDTQTGSKTSNSILQ